MRQPKAGWGQHSTLTRSIPLHTSLAHPRVEGPQHGLQSCHARLLTSVVPQDVRLCLCGLILTPPPNTGWDEPCAHPGILASTPAACFGWQRHPHDMQQSTQLIAVGTRAARQLPGVSRATTTKGSSNQAIRPLWSENIKSFPILSCNMSNPHKTGGDPSPAGC